MGPVRRPRANVRVRGGSQLGEPQLMPLWARRQQGRSEGGGRPVDVVPLLPQQPTSPGQPRRQARVGRDASRLAVPFLRRLAVEHVHAWGGFKLLRYVSRGDGGRPPRQGRASAWPRPSPRLRPRSQGQWHTGSPEVGATGQATANRKSRSGARDARGVRGHDATGTGPPGACNGRRVPGRPRVSTGRASPPRARRECHR